MTDQGLQRQAAAPHRRRVCFAAAVLGGFALVGAWVVFRPGLAVPGGDLLGAEPLVARAVEDARAAVRAAPQSASAWGRLGMLLMTHEWLPQARECFRQAETRDPRDVRWVYLRAFAHLKDDPALAAELLERAVALAEGDPTCRLLLADTLLGLGRADDAETHYLGIAGHPEAEARAHLGLARVALSRDDLPHALEHARTAARLSPLRRNPSELLAQIYLRMGDAAAARREQARLAELVDSPWSDPYLAEVMSLNVAQAPRLELAQRLLNQGLSRDALAILEATVRDYPDSVPAWLSLCRALLRLGQWVPAQAAAERALALRSDDGLAWADLGTALAEQGHLERAANCYRRSIRLHPQDGDTHYQLAFCHLRLGERPAAERSFRESVRVRPQFAAGWRELGRLLADGSADVEAAACLRRAVELAPADDVARGLLIQVTKQAESKRPPK